MWRNKADEVPLQNPESSQNRDSIRDLRTAWDAFSQSKTTLQHIENKLEVAPVSIALLDSVMEKKPSISTTRKISRKACRASRQKKESCPRSPLRVTTLDSNVSKNGHVEFREPSICFRNSQWSPSYHTSCQLETRCLKRKEAGNKAERSCVAYGKGEPNLHGRDFKSSSSTDETVVRYLNDRPAIDALQSSDVIASIKSEDEIIEGPRRDECIRTPSSTTVHDAELKELQLGESSASSATTSSAHRLDILKQHQHDAKLEKLKERIRKQWECPQEQNIRGRDFEYSDQPVTIAAAENIVTPKVRKVATAPPAPTYKGFNPSEAKIRTPDGKVWCEEEFLNLSRELCRDLEFQSAEEDLTVIKTPTEKRERKAPKPVRKIQKIAQLSSPDFKPGGANIISTTSWRDGQRLAKKLLGPSPKIEQQDTQTLLTDRNGKDKSTKSASCTQVTESDCNMYVTTNPPSKCPEHPWNKIKAKNILKKKDAAPQDGDLGNDHVNKDFLPVEIRGMLDDLQLDSVSQGAEKEGNEKCQNQESEPSLFSRSHSPNKQKSDKVSVNENTQFVFKKRHYDADEVRQYIVRQQEERRKKQSEEKKAQKDATEQKNKRLQELYKKQKEALTNRTKTAPTSEIATKQLQDTYSKLVSEEILLEKPALPVQEIQSIPGYQPSGESDKENKVQERPLSASSSSDMSLSEQPHPLVRNNTLESLRIHPDRLSKAHLPCSKSAVLNGIPFSQLLSMNHVDILQNDFESVSSTRRSHNTALGSTSLTSQPFMTSPVQPTINQYKSKLDRIEALKATAASLSSRIESEAKKLAGAGINYAAVWESEHDWLQEDQGDVCWAKVSSPPVREDDVFSARLQKMLGTCFSHTSLDENLPGVGNLHEFKNLPETISPRTAALSLPGNSRPEGILGNLPQKQACSPDCENTPVVQHDSSVGSISEGLLSDGILSEEEGEKPNYPSLKIAEVLNEKEFCVADKTGYEPIKEFQKEAEKLLPIFTPIRSGPRPWEELSKGSPHSVINIFTKSYQLCGKESEESERQGSQRPLLPVMSPPASIVSYDDDFISSQGSCATTDKKVTLELSATSSSSPKEEFASRKLPYELQTSELIHHSSGPPSSVSSRSSASSKRRGRKKPEYLNALPNASLWEESKVSPGSGHGLEQGKHLLPNNAISNREQEQNPDSDSSIGELSGHSLMSLPDKVKSPRTAGSSQSPDLQKKIDPIANTTGKNISLNSSAAVASGSKLNPSFSNLSIGINRTGANSMTGCMRFSPAGLQHRMSAELNYLSTIEESVHQISDIERVREISLAQQESASLALILKTQQQHHERDLALLKLKAEQEALESQRQLEEARQKASQIHAESLNQLAQSQQEAAEALQETTSKIAAHQMETALLTTDAARQIREMTELARFQISNATGTTAPPITTLFDQERKQHSAFIKQLNTHNMSRKAESITTSQTKEEIGDSKHHYFPSFDYFPSESARSKVHDQSSSSSCQESPSSKETKNFSLHEKPSSSIKEEAPVTVNDSLQNNSIPSIPDERDSTSAATEYSLKFDESMTEDEIEERSFRSLLPSESHRRINLKKRGHQVYSDEEVSPGNTTLSHIKELSLPFSGGQDSFSKFTMEMVRQYMKEEEMRAAHQSSLLRLREKALKEKAKAELAWLEHQKRRLRDKGEDDKMPPIRKKQRGLLLKLQQEKAEIKRLQEANKAARKERQLILKQQEEIERIRHTTMKLQEKLKSAGENKVEHRSEDDIKQTHSSSPLPTDAEVNSPSSISSSETSSIMQKLKKMRSRMDEKFLTKREQKLMQRRQHAEELLQWKRRLDAEEAEIRQIEKQALAAWEKELHKTKANKKGAGDQKSDQREIASEEDSSVPPCSRLNSESSIPEEVGKLAVESVMSKVSDNQGQCGSLDHTLTGEVVYTQELESAASSGKHSPCKTGASLAKQESSKETHWTGGKQHLSTKAQDISYSWSDESLSMTQSETTSDQSDIESRIWALKDELRKRKSVVYQLKKEQKKRHKERLKAQEASLIKQLETYDEFIKKTEEELNRDLEATPTAKPQIKTLSSASEKPKIKPPPLHRTETTKSWKSLTDSERSRGSLESIAEHVDGLSLSEQSLITYNKKFTETEIQAEQQIQTPSPVLQILRSSTETGDLDNLVSSAVLRDLGDTRKVSHISLNYSEDAGSYDSALCANGSVLQETEESAKCEPGILPTASEKANSTAFDFNENSSAPVSLKADVPAEIELSETNHFLDCVCVQESKELAEGRFKDVESTISVKSSDKLSKDVLKGNSLVSVVVSICEEPSYSNDFEETSSRKKMSKNDITVTEYYKDIFDASTLSFRHDTRSQGERFLYARASRSRSPGIGSDDEISECLDEKSLSVAGTIHSETLLEQKLPTEFINNKEHDDVEKELAHEYSSLWASSLKAATEEQGDSDKKDILLGFSIGDRVLVSNVQPGTLRFKGLTNFAEGFWAGVELDKPEGNNNGSYNGIRYFDCKEKHGIFAPPQKISLISESFDNGVDSNDFFPSKDKLDYQHKTNEKGSNSLEEEKNKGRNSNETSPRESSPLEKSVGDGDLTKLTSQMKCMAEIISSAEELDQENNIFYSPKSSINENSMLTTTISNTQREASVILGGGILDSSFPEIWKVWQEQTEKSNSLSPGSLEKSATPLLDLLTKERCQLEAQFEVASQEEEYLIDQQKRVGLLTHSLLQVFVNDAVSQLQQIKKARNEKIKFSNQELTAFREKVSANEHQRFLVESELDDGEEVSSPDMCPRPESPVFGASGQEELAKRLAELELSREFLNVLGDDQDWFDEDFGLGSHKLPQKQGEESAVLPKIELPDVPPKPCEESFTVPYISEEVEDLVHAAAEKLWKCKDFGHDPQALSLPREMNKSPENDDIEAVSKQIYKQAVFDLTREIFGEIFAEDPNLNQPIWMKPSRIISGYFRRVKDPNDLEEIKTFIATEVLKLLHLKKESDNKTDWQKMMKFGRKKRDRVDHILVQELHEEEAQWVNYDEDELYVKMQLADGIFEALIRETVDLLNQITEKQEKLLLV